jgi:DNA-binding MarR family transcriptional regulator
MDKKRQRGTPPSAAPAGESAPGFVPIEGVNVPGAGRPQSVGFTVSSLGYAVASAFRELLVPLGLDPKVFALLASVASSEGVTQQAIAGRLQVAPSRMVAAVDSLEERGLLERRQNPDDRRARALYLTQAGRALLVRAFAVADEHEQRLTSDLSGEERGQLLDMLGRVGAHVGIPRGVQPATGHSAPVDELK